MFWRDWFITCSFFTSYAVCILFFKVYFKRFLRSFFVLNFANHFYKVSSIFIILHFKHFDFIGWFDLNSSSSNLFERSSISDFSDCFFFLISMTDYSSWLKDVWTYNKNYVKNIQKLLNVYTIKKKVFCVSIYRWFYFLYLLQKHGENRTRSWNMDKSRNSWKKT